MKESALSWDSRPDFHEKKCPGLTAKGGTPCPIWKMKDIGTSTMPGDIKYPTWSAHLAQIDLRIGQK